MCIAVYSNVSLGIPLLQEQIWCQPDVNELHVTECYDLVLQNHGDVPTRTIMMISPHILFDPKTDTANSRPRIKLPSFDQAAELNWYMSREDDVLSHPSCGDGRIKFRIPRYARPEASPEYRDYDCRVLEGDVAFHPALIKSTPSLWESFLRLKCTVVELRLKQALQPYRQDKEAYWVRLVLEPSRLNHRVSSRVLSPPAAGTDERERRSSGFCVQPCEIMAPNVVFYKMRSLFERLRDFAGTSAARDSLEQEFVVNGFDRPESVSWVEDHRISVITADGALVVDSQRLGAVAFHMVEPAGKSDLHAWTWNAGMQHFPYEDPYVAACTLYSYLSRRANGAERAIPREKVAHETGVPPRNTRFVLEALREEAVLGYVNGGYYVKKNAESLKSLLTQAQIRAAMAKALDFGRGPVRFPGKSFLVQFSLLWAL